jgi:hypothetical protein
MNSYIETPYNIIFVIENLSSIIDVRKIYMKLMIF